MPSAILSLNSILLKYLAEPAARSLLLAAFAAVAIAAFRLRGVSWKAVIWRGVLAAALAMPLLGGLMPAVRVPLPVPVRAVPERATVVQQDQATNASLETQNVNSAADVKADAAPRVNSAQKISAEETLVAAAAPTRPIPWTPILAAFYLLVVLLLLARVLAGAVMGSRLVRKAAPVGDGAALRQLSALARKAGLRLQPLLAQSEILLVPVTLRVLRPAILLPSSWREWDEMKLRAVLAHEISHVARRDALVQQLALIHRAIFWFSPLAWWLPAYLNDLAEQASDEAALACCMDRTQYAETLLGFIAALENCRRRVWWQGVAMAKPGSAEKRLDRILAWRSAMPKQMRKSLLVAIAVLAAPLIALTASVHPFFFNFPQSPAPASPPSPAPPSAQAPATPAPAPVPAPSVQPTLNPGPTPQASAVAPVPPAGAVTPPAAAVAPLPPAVAVTPPAMPPAAASDDAVRLHEELVQAQSAVRAAKEQLAKIKAQLSSPPSAEQVQAMQAAVDAYNEAMASYQETMSEYRAAAATQAAGGVSGGVEGGVSGGTSGGVHDGVYDDSGRRFVIVTKGSDSVIMSGSSEDAAHAKALRSKISGDFIWFERDEKPYVIRDAATVQRAKQFWQPVEDLGRQQKALGEQQELLGQTQENLGRQMEAVRVKIPDLSGQMEKLEAEMKQLSANGGTVDQIGDLQSQIGELQSRIGEIQSQAGRQQGEIGRQQGELGRKQGELGRQQGELGQRQAELSRQASKQMKQLLDDALAHGLAQPE
jgi:beta-lactamase regulating signal transducer with metallopeptidase domain/predicted  nucleic acid-binding Zn-ribbon protein